MPSLLWIINIGLMLLLPYHAYSDNHSRRIQPVDRCPLARELAIKGLDLYDAQPQEGITALKQAWELCPSNAKIGFNYGQMLYLQGKKEAALELWIPLADKNPEIRRLWANMSWAHFELGMDKKALRLANEGLEKDRFAKDPALVHTKLFALFRMGRYLEAYDWLVKQKLSTIRADKWRRQAAEYVIESHWQRFRMHHDPKSIAEAVNLLAQEYPDESLFIDTKDKLLRAIADPNAEIPFATPLPHEAWPKSGKIDEGEQILDAKIQSLPALESWHKRADAFTVITGIQRYKNIRSRLFSRRDAQNLHDLLMRRGLFLNDPNHTRLRLDKEADQKTLLADLDWLAQKGKLNPNAMLLFYYSGHALPWYTKTGEIELLLLPVETRPEAISPATTVPLSWFKKKLEKLPNREIIVIIDSCYNNPDSPCIFRHGKPLPTALAHFFQGSKPWISAALKKPALPYKPGRQSAFTFFLLKGLLGEITRSNTYHRDRWIHLGEVLHFIRRSLKEKQIPLDIQVSHPDSIRMTMIKGNL
ncbi:caspase family protein [Magnetococcales bacterium HHB-1]